MSRRAEFRRQKVLEEKKTKTYTFTRAQMEDMIRDASQKAVDKAFILMMGLPLMALRDEEGFGRVRLTRFSDKVLDLYDSFNRDYFTLDDVKKCIKDETGVEITGEQRFII